MKFIHIAGDYRCVDGHTFLFRNSVTVENKTTIAKLLTDNDFEVVNERQVTVASPDACPKCGRIIKQGKFMHAKYCKGAS